MSNTKQIDYEKKEDISEDDSGKTTKLDSPVCYGAAKTLDVPDMSVLSSMQYTNSMQMFSEILEDRIPEINKIADFSKALPPIEIPENTLNRMRSNIESIYSAMNASQQIILFNNNISSLATSSIKSAELEQFFSQYDLLTRNIEKSIQEIAKYAFKFSVKWDKVVTNTGLLERSISAQNIAFIKMIPHYNSFELPRGSKSVLKSLTKETAEELLVSENIQFDIKEKDFYHKDFPDAKISGDELTVMQSSLEVFDFLTLNDLVELESELFENPAFASQHRVGKLIYDAIKNMHTFADFKEITYYHARSLKEGDAPYLDAEMLKAPMGVSGHGRYNEIGKSCYYIAETKEGATKEIKKHSGGKHICIQVVGLKAMKHVKLLDLSGTPKKNNKFIEHMRFSVDNEEARFSKSYLLPNYVASCCKKLGIDGIRYQSTGYKCIVLWKDDYFEFADGSREIIEP